MLYMPQLFQYFYFHVTVQFSEVPVEPMEAFFFFLAAVFDTKRSGIIE